MEDLHTVGGLPAVMKMLLAEGLLHGDCLTVTGKTMRGECEGSARLAAGQQIVRPVSNPLKATGQLQILRGNLRRRRGRQDHRQGRPQVLRSGERLRFRRS